MVNTVLARQRLDLATKALRTQRAQDKRARKRRKTKPSLSSETIRRVSQNAFKGLGKEWNHYSESNQTEILKNLLIRCGYVGKVFLGSLYKDNATENIQNFFARVSRKSSAKNIRGTSIVKAAVSGENLEPRDARRLFAPSSRLEIWQKARDYRLSAWTQISDLVNKNLYSREPRFPLAVPLLIVNLAKDCSEIDPSVGKIVD